MVVFVFVVGDLLIVLALLVIEAVVVEVAVAFDFEGMIVVLIEKEAVTGIESLVGIECYFDKIVNA